MWADVVAKIGLRPMSLQAISLVFESTIVKHTTRASRYVIKVELRRFRSTTLSPLRVGKTSCKRRETVVVDVVYCRFWAH